MHHACNPLQIDVRRGVQFLGPEQRSGIDSKALGICIEHLYFRRRGFYLFLLALIKKKEFAEIEPRRSEWARHALNDAEKRAVTFGRRILDIDAAAARPDHRHFLDRNPHSFKPFELVDLARFEIGRRKDIRLGQRICFGNDLQAVRRWHRDLGDRKGVRVGARAKFVDLASHCYKVTDRSVDGRFRAAARKNEDSFRGIGVCVGFVVRRLDKEACSITACDYSGRAHRLTIKSRFILATLDLADRGIALCKRAARQKQEQQPRRKVSLIANFHLFFTAGLFAAPLSLALHVEHLKRNRIRLDSRQRSP